MSRSKTAKRTPAPSPLKTLREARRLSLRQVAAAADIDVAHYWRIEEGLATPSVPALRRIAGALGLKELEIDLAPYDRSAAETAATRKPRARRTASKLGVGS